MAPRKPAKSQTQVSESEENSQQGSPELLKAAKNMMSKHSSHRDTKRKTIEDEYEKRAKDIGQRIDKLFEARKSRVTKSRKALWDRLDALNKKRQSLEHKILTSMKTVETHTLNISSELIAMFEGRIEELEERTTPEA